MLEAATVGQQTKSTPWHLGSEKFQSLGTVKRVAMGGLKGPFQAVSSSRGTEGSIARSLNFKLAQGVVALLLARPGEDLVADGALAVQLAFERGFLGLPPGCLDADADGRDGPSSEDRRRLTG